MGALLLSVALVLLPWLFKLDGRPHADWQQFLGRFHPLAVHIPVGLIVLVPVLEIAGTFRPALREAAGFVLRLGFASCLGALTLGYLLVYGSGNAGAGVTRHMWGGIALTIGALVCVLARPWWSSGSVPRVYPVLLTCMLLVLVWAAHQGGSLTHGDNYLTAYMPAPLKSAFMLRSAAGSASFYASHINPILDTKCVSCHGESNTKGGLRLDSYERLMKGGRDGPVIIAGKPDRSLLLERVTLPADHKQFMPAESKPPLRPEEIAWIGAWVQQGASPSATTLAGISVEEPKDLPLQLVSDYSALMPEIQAMQQGQGTKLLQVSKNPADGLTLNTVDISRSFGDAQLAQFQRFAPYIVEADLARTTVTNACFDTLSKFTHLRVLHLEETGVTGEGLAKLAPLSQLTYLNLSETTVTEASVAPLRAMKNLHHVYLYNTPAKPGTATESTQSIARNAP
jgi:uncharacterized membrane protein